MSIKTWTHPGRIKKILRYETRKGTKRSFQKMDLAVRIEHVFINPESIRKGNN